MSNMLKYVTAMMFPALKSFTSCKLFGLQSHPKKQLAVGLTSMMYWHSYLKALLAFIICLTRKFSSV